MKYTVEKNSNGLHLYVYDPVQKRVFAHYKLSESEFKVLIDSINECLS